MKRIIYLFSVITVLLSSVSCEVQIPVGNGESRPKVSVTSLALAGEKLYARVAFAEDINDAENRLYSDNYVMWRMLKFSISGDIQDSLLTEKYYNRLVIKNADVKAVVNGRDEYAMAYNKTTRNYESDYRPVAGDRIEIVVKTDENDANSATRKLLISSCKSAIPIHKADFELLDCAKVYRAKYSEDKFGAEEAGVDSVALMKLVLKDASKDLHCYRIKVTSCRCLFDKFNSTVVALNPISAFFTDSPLLRDYEIENSFGPWQAYTTDVFTNKDFVNGEYVLSLSSRVWGWTSNNYRFIEIELQPITRELMEYLTALYRLRASDDSYFKTTLPLPTNVSDGTGIFGAIGESKIIRFWWPGEEHPDYPSVN